MAFYSLRFKNRQGRTQIAFLLEKEEDHAAWSEALSLDRGDLSVELWQGERLVGSLSASPPHVREPAPQTKVIDHTPAWHRIAQVVA